jgi:hypothetical protein
VVSFVLAGVIGLGGVLATRDWLVMEGAAWRAGQSALNRGISVFEIEGGVGWDGYHVYELAREEGLNRAEPGGPGWVQLWNLPIQPVAVVTSQVPAGYCILDQTSYDLVFGGRRTIFLATLCR